jgi:hypothetical protein
MGEGWLDISNMTMRMPDQHNHTNKKMQRKECKIRVEIGVQWEKGEEGAGEESRGRTTCRIA